MNARDIQKWERTKELAEELGIEIKLGEGFWVIGADNKNYGQLQTLDEVYGYIVGFESAKSEVNY